MEADGTAVQG